MGERRRHVGVRLRQDVVGEGRGAYGEQVVAVVAKMLSAEYGRGFGKCNLHYMLRFAEVFPDPEIVQALRAQLSWTHMREIIALDAPLKRQFYAELCRRERWSTRTLQRKIAGMLFERTAIAKRPEAVVEQALATLEEEGRVTPDLVFRDPYVLDFLGLPVDYSERELEAAILREIESFLLELLQLTDGSIRVASYLTELPPRTLLEKKLLEAIAHARTHLEDSSS